VLLLTALLGLSFDLATKSWAFANVADRPVVLDRETLVADPDIDPVPRNAEHVVIPDLLQLRLVINRGAVFGFAANQRTFFVGFTMLAIVGGLLVFGLMTSPGCRVGHLAIGLVLAGGIGNLYDRIRFGAVRDFLHTMPGFRLPFDWTWPGGNPELCPWVFNVADMLLLVGMVLLMRHLSRRRRLRQALESAAARSS
jgi:signal peptidase II